MRFLCAILIFISSASNAQLSISPAIGLDWMQLEKPGVNWPGNGIVDILDEGYVNSGYVAGLELQYKLTDQFSMASAGFFTKKKYKADLEGNFWDVKGITFDYYSGEASLRYRFGQAYVSGGFRMGFIRNMQYEYQTAGDKFKADIHGVLVGTGIQWNKMNLNVYYFASLHDVELDYFLKLRPVRSFGVYAGYELFSIERAGGKVRCPRL